jgi:hypothetical protein
MEAERAKQAELERQQALEREQRQLEQSLATNFVVCVWFVTVNARFSRCRSAKRIVERTGNQTGSLNDVSTIQSCG